MNARRQALVDGHGIARRVRRAGGPAGAARRWAGGGRGVRAGRICRRAFTVCGFDPRHDDIRLYWTGPARASPTAASPPFKRELARTAAARFAMNAGMFREDRRRSGSMSRRQALAHADTRRRRVNFHLKPNGVFWIGDGVAGVAETGRYLASPPAARYATQSGPDAGDRRKIHRRSVLTAPPQDPQRRLRGRPSARPCSPSPSAGDVLRLRPAVPRRPRLRQCAVPRRLGVVALCARTRRN